MSRVVTFHVPEPLLEGMEELVRLGYYMDISDVIRTAVRDLLRRELWRLEVEVVE